MITNYDEFLLEQALTMINESEIVYSKTFRKLLRNIESPVAKCLFDIESNDLKVPSNFFDVSDTKDTISFIADRKAQEIIGENKEKVAIYNDGPILTHNIEQNGRIFGLLGYTPQGKEGYNPDSGEKGKVIAKATSPTSGKRYLYLKFDGGECVVNEDYIAYDESTDVWTKNRQSVRTGRGIKALLSAASKKFTDSEIEDFVNKYKAAFDKMNDVFSNFDVVKGDDIAHWYSSSNYRYGTQRGTLGNSCMATVDSSYFNIYTENPEVCSLLILRSDDNPDKIKGRALVWKLDSPDITFVDRIYTHDDSDIELFKDYTKQKKWHYKKDNDSSPDAYTISPEGSSVDHDVLSVSVKKSSYPEKTLSTKESSSAKCLEDTSGSFVGGECEMCNGNGRVDCPDCDGSGSEDCYKCDGNGVIECKTCEGDGEIEGKTCSDCEGDGEVTCKECDGEGTHDCNNCDGNGRVECPECNN